jgi:IMP dehydrogenase
MFKQCYSFDDVLLSPLKSDIESRAEIDIGNNIKDINFKLPIVSSPMDTVTEAPMAKSMSEHGGLGIIHRYNTIHQQVMKVNEALLTDGSRKIGVAVGVSGDYIERASESISAGVSVVCVDIAHGHHSLMERALKSLKDRFGDICIIAGNVATPEGYYDLSQWGADAVRVGIGGGSICSTRIQTGHGVPTFQSVLACSHVDIDTPIIADGGIKSAGDVVKSLAAGADFVMLGSMLAGTDEAPGQVFEASDSKKYKVYRGMASKEAQTAWRGSTSSLEGISTTIPYKGSVDDILTELAQNIRSGLSYSGAKNISELRSKANFIVQTGAGQTESRTHILNVR